MFLKKKNGSHQSQQKNQIAQALSSRKGYQKHSRQPTKDIPKYFQSIILRVHKRNAQSCRDQILGYQMNTLLANESSAYTISTKEVTKWADDQEYIGAYHILSKHEDGLKARPNIETHLFQTIRNKEPEEFMAKALPHYESHIYSIMSHHASKMRKLHKKRQQQNSSSLNNLIQTYKKELPTHINSNDKEQSNNSRGGQPRCEKVDLLSESYEIKALADCIKQMFVKQGVMRGELGVSKINENSWLKERRRSEEKNFIDCDFSSIEIQSRFDLMVESRIRKTDCVEAEETYGLGQLKRRYQQQRMSQLKQSSGFKALGHKRNPTEALHCKKQFQISDPLTPKEHPARSAFGSSKNLPSGQSRQKSKDKSPYLLTFQKHKKSKPSHNLAGLKQNKKETFKLKLSKCQPRSKSKSRQKLSFRSGNLAKDSGILAKNQSKRV